MRSRIPFCKRYGVRFNLMETMKREADSFMQYDYDEQTSNDISLASNTIRNLINRMWKSSTVTHPTGDEWSEHGIYQYGRRVIIHGPMDVRSCMTDLFNDISFNSKAEAEDSYATIKRAYRVLSSYSNFAHQKHSSRLEKYGIVAKKTDSLCTFSQFF